MLGKNFIYVGGVPASGKTTLCDTLSKRLCALNYISSGEIKRPEARSRYGISLSHLDQNKSLVVNEWFFNNLFEKSKEGIYLVDTHYTYPLSDFSFVNLCPENIAKDINLFLLVETNYRDIVERRIKRGRDRDSINEDFIKVEIKKERGEAIRLSKKFSVPLIILKNERSLESSLLDFSYILRV